MRYPFLRENQTNLGMTSKYALLSLEEYEQWVKSRGRPNVTTTSTSGNEVKPSLQPKPKDPGTITNLSKSENNVADEDHASIDTCDAIRDHMLSDHSPLSNVQKEYFKALLLKSDLLDCDLSSSLKKPKTRLITKRSTNNKKNKVAKCTDKFQSWLSY